MAVRLPAAVHRPDLDGIACCTDEHWARPLGLVDAGATAAAADLRQLVDLPLVHERETSVEVQLPWLVSRVEQLRMLPMLVGSTTQAQVEEVLDWLWGDERSVVVARACLASGVAEPPVEQEDAQPMERLVRGGAIGADASGSPVLLSALAAVAARRGLVARVLDHRMTPTMGRRADAGALPGARSGKATVHGVGPQAGTAQGSMAPSATGLAAIGWYQEA